MSKSVIKGFLHNHMTEKNEFEVQLKNVKKLKKLHFSK